MVLLWRWTRVNINERKRHETNVFLPIWPFRVTISKIRIYSHDNWYFSGFFHLLRKFQIVFFLFVYLLTAITSSRTWLTQSATANSASLKAESFFLITLGRFVTGSFFSYLSLFIFNIFYKICRKHNKQSWWCH